MTEENKEVVLLVQKAFAAQKYFLPLTELRISTTVHSPHAIQTKDGRILGWQETRGQYPYALGSPLLRVAVEGKDGDGMIMYQGLWFGVKDNALVAPSSPRYSQCIAHLNVSRYTAEPEKWVQNETQFLVA